MEKSEMKSQLLPMNELELPLDGSLRRRKRKSACITLTINTVLCLITCIVTIVCVTYASWAISEINNAKIIVDAKIDNGLRTVSPDEDNRAQPQQYQQQTKNSQSGKTKDNASTGRSGGKATEHEILPEENQEDKDFGFNWAENSKEDDTDYNSISETVSDGNGITNDSNQDEEDTLDNEDNYYYNDLDDDLYRDADEWRDDKTPTENSYYDWDDTSEDQLYGSGDFNSDDEDSISGREKRSATNEENNKESDENTDKKTKKSRKKGRGKPCKGKECQKGKKKRKEVIPLTAQYEATVSDEFITKNLPTYDKLQNTDECRYIDEMRGVLCRSRLFTPIDYNAPLNIFHPTAWVSNKKSPLKKVDGSSSFQIKTNGVILIFAQVSFSTNRPTNGASIVQSRTSKGPVTLSQAVQELQCKQGIPDPDTFEEKVSQSCSIVGLLTVKKGDTLEIFSNYDGSSLDLSAGSSYFGVVQLTKG